MCSAEHRVLGLLPVMLFILVGSLFAQGSELFESGLPRLLEERQKEAELPGTTKRREEIVPLDGKVDRHEYVLGPGDQLDISVWGTDPLVSKELYISAEGRLLMPPAGALDVAGMTLAEAERYIDEKLGEYFSTETRITLSLINPRTFRVYVAGSVIAPGTYAITAVDRVSDAVNVAGGILRGGSRRRIQLYDRDRTLIREVDLLHHQATGSQKSNPTLCDGGIVEVPPIKQYVVLTGNFPYFMGRDTVRVKDWNLELANEFPVEFLDGESLNDLFELTGEPITRSGEIYGRRILSDTTGARGEFIELTPEMYERPLEHGEHYEFPERRFWVFVTGSTNNWGRFIYQPGWTVKDYLGQAGGPNYNGSRKKVYLRRANGEEIEADFNAVIYPGDTIFVPEKFHMERYLPVVLSGIVPAVLYIIFGN